MQLVKHPNEVFFCGAFQAGHPSPSDKAMLDLEDATRTSFPEFAYLHELRKKLSEWAEGPNRMQTGRRTGIRKQVQVISSLWSFSFACGRNGEDDGTEGHIFGRGAFGTGPLQIPPLR